MDNLTDAELQQIVNVAYGMGVMDTLMGLARNAEGELRKNLINKMGSVVVKSEKLGSPLDEQVLNQFTSEFFTEYVQNSINLN